MVGLALAAALAAQAGDWTWTLYENADSIVLANEVPDTARLRTVLECEPHSGVARVTVYGLSAATNGFVSLSSGEARAAIEAESEPSEDPARLGASLRLDHPVFSGFLESGDLTLRAGEQDRTIRVERRHRPKLRRFAALCGG